MGAAAVAQTVLDRCRDISEELDNVFLGSSLEGLRKEDVAFRMKEKFEKTEMKIWRGLLEACSITMRLILHNLSTAQAAIFKDVHENVPDPQCIRWTSRQNNTTLSSKTSFLHDKPPSPTSNNLSQETLINIT